MMNKKEKLERLDKFIQLTEASGWIPSRNEYPPVLTEEDERILSRVWKELNEELNEELFTENLDLKGDTTEK